jgi:acyl-CoA dehydrogenase
MEFGYSQRQHELREQAQEIARDFGEAYWRGVEENESFPREYWEHLTEEGMLGITIPKEYGGSGLGFLDLTVAAEALAEAGGGLGGGSMPVLGPVFGGSLLERHGNEAQKERFLPGIARGEIWAGAFTEEESGSNVSAIRTFAERKGGNYVLNGHKKYVGVARVGQHITILARTTPLDPAKKTGGVSLFVADLPDERLRTRRWKKLGTRWMDTNELFIEDLEVPAENVVGEEGGGWKPLYDVLNPERFVIAGAAVGAGLLCVRKAVEYETGRTVWSDAPIGSYQGVQFPLVKAKQELEAARLKVYQAAWLYDNDSPDCAPATASAKYLATHAALAAADRAMQTLGGLGYMEDGGIERHWRDLRLGRIAPVTDELALAYLAQRDLGMPRSY